ncbi:hypothetical protein B0H19DRAFT_1189529 [Mycena capillaripes]|nr:hypothetical protein B0H19DRAFT_1189529 [Mycena capillaripes]
MILIPLRTVKARKFYDHLYHIQYLSESKGNDEVPNFFFGEILSSGAEVKPIFTRPR